MAEALVFLFANEAEAGLFVDATCRRKEVVGPEHHLAITDRSSELHAFGDQARADRHSASAGLDEKEPQLGDLVGFPDAEDAADFFAVMFGYPAAFFPQVLFLDESCDDLTNEGLELFIPTVLAGVKRAVAVDDPTHVAGAGRPEDHGVILFFRGAEQALDLGQGGYEAILLRFGKAAQERTDLFMGMAVERLEDFAALLSQAKDALAGVGFGLLAGQEAAPAKSKEDSTEIAGVEAEFFGEFNGRGLIAVGEFEEDADFSEGEGAAQVAIREDTDLAGVDSIEAADGGDAATERRGGRGDTEA